MKKINGVQMIEQDWIGEVPRPGDAKLIGSACKAFFARRGISLPTPAQLNNRRFEAARRRKRRTQLP